MGSRKPELVSKATRQAFRRLATDVYVRAISKLWEDHGFLPARAIDYEDPSVRRTRFECYAAAVDWTDVSQAQRALQVFEALLRWLARQDWHTASSFDEVRELLDHDGFRLDEGWPAHSIHGRYRPGLRTEPATRPATDRGWAQGLQRGWCGTMRASRWWAGCRGHSAGMTTSRYTSTSSTATRPVGQGLESEEPRRPRAWNLLRPPGLDRCLDLAVKAAGGIDADHGIFGGTLPAEHTRLRQHPP